MNDTAAVLLAAYSAIAAIDGIYYHLWKYRLFANESSRREHHLHTAHSALFVVVLGALYLVPAAGPLLWLGVGAAVAASVVAILDVLEERRSRTDLGGLPPREYAIHIGVTTLQAASVALVLAARPSAAWSLDAPMLLGDALPELSRTIAMNLFPGAVLMTVAHVVLGLRPVSTRLALPKPA